MDGDGAMIETHNGASFACPEPVTVDRLHDQLRAELAAGERVVAYFATGAPPDVHLTLVVADDDAGQLRVATARTDATKIPSLSREHTQLHLFEREIWEQTGLGLDRHPWLKPLRFTRPGDQVGVMEYYQIEGEAVHEVGVGPVHAGIIEPGHFRFQCHGETVFHLEISLGYQHRGVERALVHGPRKRALHVAETIAGDTTIGHATAYCSVLEALTMTRVPARALAIRAIALELERLANHIGDLGALAGDVAFLPTASFCGRIRGEFLNMTAAMCGSRFGRGLIVPGGVRFDIDAARAAALTESLNEAARAAFGAVSLLWDSSSAMARLEDTGVVGAELAAELGLVGPAARASGLHRDVRQDHPIGLFQLVHIPPAFADQGDVRARALVRWLEFQRSITFVREQLAALPDSELVVEPGPPQPDQMTVALVEAWRGEVAHVARTDERGAIAAYKVVDPSFHNWMGLAMALRDQTISDFPLCNKSFNLSYCGHDL